MKYLKTISLRLFREEDGPTAVEYAIMLALIVAVCVAAVVSVGQATNKLFEGVTF